MGFSAYRVLILLICLGFLVVQPEKVSCLRSIDLVLRWDKEDHGVVPKHTRVLKAVTMEDLNTKKKPVPASPTFDPNQSSKRMIRRGSDPIHNRSWHVQVVSSTESNVQGSHSP